MILARVEGSVTATRKHPSLDRWRLVICQPINREGNPQGTPVIAIDCFFAGMHQQVIVSSDGLAARKSVGDDRSPVRMMVTGVLDHTAQESVREGRR